MKIQRRSRFQPSSQGPGSSQAVKVPVPVKVKFLSSSSQGQVPVKFPDPRRVRSHRSDSPVQFQSRSSSCQVSGSTTSPIPLIRLRNISSSSRIHDESDPIDPTHHSSSCQGSVPVKVKVQFQFQFQDPNPFQIQPYESDPIDPTQFYFSVYGSRFQTGPKLIASVGGSIPGSESISVVSTTTSSAQKFGPALHRPPPMTYPENSTNPCAELVEAESLVICEEITWRPLFFWLLWAT